MEDLEERVRYFGRHASVGMRDGGILTADACGGGSVLSEWWSTRVVSAAGWRSVAFVLVRVVLV